MTRLRGILEATRQRAEPRLLAEVVVLVLAAVALALRVAVAGGLSRSVLSAHCLVTFAAAVAVSLLPGRRLWLDGPRVVLLGIALWSLPSVYGRIGGDGVEYYVQARSFLFDHDLDFENDYHGLGAQPISISNQITSRMPAGVALFWMPPLALAHVGASIASFVGVDVSTDGFSPIYQAAATASTFLYGFLALALMESALRKQYDRPAALLVVVGIWLATPLHYYMVANPFMSHGASVLAATAFLLSYMKARSSESWRLLVFTGICGGLMVLVRVQDAVIFLIPVVDIVLGREPNRLKRLGALFVGPVACGLLQSAIWLQLYGAGFVQTLLSIGRVTKPSPQVLGLLLSPRHGLLTWTPIFIASLLGWLLLGRNNKRIVLGIWLAFAFAVLLNSTHADWWGSDSFGQRRMLGLLPLFAWGLAETVEALRRRPMVLLTVAVALLVLWNSQLAYIYNGMMIGSRNDALHLDRVTEAQIEVAYRKLLRSHRWMPSALWIILYDNLKGVWLHDGTRSFRGVVDLGDEPQNYFPLVGDGWFEPEEEEGVTFRQSRTQRSWLTVPIRTPKDYELVVRARGEVEGHTISASLDVNGNSVGTMELSPGWSLYHFEVPASTLQPGINRLAFVYSETPRTMFPDFHGRNTVMSVDWLRFTPRAIE